MHEAGDICTLTHENVALTIIVAQEEDVYDGEDDKPMFKPSK